MSSMFSNMYNLVSIKGLEGFDTSKVTKLSYMFQDDRAITSLNVGSFDTSNVTNVQGMFQGCYYLSQLDLSGFDLSKVTKYYQALNGTYRLKKVVVSDKIPAQVLRTLGTPQQNYISGADGKWYQSGGTAYTTQKLPGLTADTYYAQKSLIGT